MLWLVTRTSPLRVSGEGARDALITAFVDQFQRCHAAGHAALQKAAPARKRTSPNFVVPLGATANMDGTALYEAAAPCSSRGWRASSSISSTSW